MSVVLRVDPGDPTPPFEQLRRQLATMIDSGVLADGSRLPPVRQLAADLRLAPGTIARSYQELERAGLVQTRRGAGTRVRTDAAALSHAQVAREAERLATELVTSARLRGVPDEAIRQAVERALDEP